MSRNTNWMFWTLILAGIYNLAWGAWVILWPNAMFQFAGLEPPRYPQIWQCLGMVVGVYGVGYWIAAYDPLRHWPIILVGLLGKVLGPIGFVRAAWAGDLPWAFGWTNVTNDLIWWVPFSLILWKARAPSSEVTAPRANSLPSVQAREDIKVS